MTSPQKDYSPGWMGVLINPATGPRNKQTTLGGGLRTHSWRWTMDTRGMTWIVPRVMSLPAKRGAAVLFIICLSLNNINVAF